MLSLSTSLVRSFAAFATLATAALTGCSAGADATTDVASDVASTDDTALTGGGKCNLRGRLHPVCGEDGTTYMKPCFAEKAGVTVAHDGKCEDVVVCTEQYQPVCGVDGTTYGNACQAGSAHVAIDHDGECAPQIMCPMNYLPVCGEDGKTYGNACQAGAASVATAHDGECVRACPRNYQPVCGEDDKTYGNACMAEAAHVVIAHDGECQLPPIEPGPFLCDPTLFCAQMFSCVEGKVYPTLCGPANCDAPMGVCNN